MESAIKIYVDFNDIDKYKYISSNENYYSTKESCKAHQKYFKHRNDIRDLLSDIATSPLKSAFDAYKQVFIKTSTDIIENLADEAIKDMVKRNPNMTWQD